MNATSNLSTPSPLANPWVQLIIGVICMACVANLQYGWTLFVNPIDAITPGFHPWKHPPPLRACLLYGISPGVPLCGLHSELVSGPVLRASRRSGNRSEPNVTPSQMTPFAFSNSPKRRAANAPPL